MADPSLHTTRLLQWQERMRAGDPNAREEMLRAAGDRLERLARKMLRRFPKVRRWAETGDVLHGALLRLLRALETVQVPSVRDFFGLAAEPSRCAASCSTWPAASTARTASAPTTPARS